MGRLLSLRAEHADADARGNTQISLPSKPLSELYAAALLRRPIIAQPFRAGIARLEIKSRRDGRRLLPSLPRLGSGTREFPALKRWALFGRLPPAFSPSAATSPRKDLR